MHKIFMQKKEQFISAKIAPRTFQNQNSRILILEPSFKKYKTKKAKTQYTVPKTGHLEPTTIKPTNNEKNEPQ